MESTVYCPVHGLFSHMAVVDHSCPKCGRRGEPIPYSFARLEDCLDVLVDPAISVKGLLSLRQLAVAAEEGLLTAEEAERGAARLALPCAELFSRLRAAALYAELAEALGAVLKARFTAASDLRAEELGDDDIVASEGDGRDERPEL